MRSLVVLGVVAVGLAAAINLLTPMSDTAFQEAVRVEKKFRPQYQLEDATEPYRTKLAFWSQKLSEDPHNHIAAVRIAAAHFALGRVSSDERHFRDAEQFLAELRSTFANHHCIFEPMYARALMTRHGFKEALEIAEQLTAKCANSAVVSELLHDARMGLGDYELAVEADGQLERRSYSAMLRKAEILRLHGEEEEVLRLFIQAMREIPATQVEPSIWIRLRIGIVFLEQERLEEAEHFFNAALSLAPNYFLGVEHLAEIREKQERWEEARDLLERSLKLHVNPEVQLRLAAVYQQLGQGARATELASLAEKELERMAMESSAHLRPYVEHLLEGGTELELALRLAREDHKLRPGDIQANLLLAKACRLNGDQRCAKEHFAHAARVNPTHPLILEEQQALAST